MRGKKSDPVFISLFIQESVTLGCESQEDIAKRAKSIIQEIDEQIKQVEELRIKRSKLLDVISAFDKPIKDKTEESKLLSFFKLEHPKICKHLCDMVKNNPIPVYTNGMVPYDTTYSIKQLLECKVLARVGDVFIRGDRFDDYMTFVLREV